MWETLTVNSHYDGKNLQIFNQLLFCVILRRIYKFVCQVHFETN